MGGGVRHKSNFTLLGLEKSWINFQSCNLLFFLHDFGIDIKQDIIYNFIYQFNLISNIQLVIVE